MNKQEKSVYLIVGANGFIGSYMVKNILERTDKKILACGHNIEQEKNSERVEWIECDVTKQQDIEKVKLKCNEYEEVKILYLAAYHLPDLVKENPKKAWNINVTALSSFINSIENVKCFFYSSTEMVYGIGNTDKKFIETDSLNPVNVYGKNKVVAEALVTGYGYNVLRFPFLIGPSLNKNKKHFYDMIVDKISNGEVFDMFKDSYRSSLDFNTAAFLLIELIKNYKNGFPKILNVSGDKDLSKYDVGMLIAEHIGCDKNLIKAISINAGNEIFNFKTPRALSTLLDNSKLKSVLKLNEINLEF